MQGPAPRRPLRLAVLAAALAAAAFPTAAQESGTERAVSPVAQGPAALPIHVHLPPDLSPWSMFLSADGLVKAVIVGLVCASVATWTVWLAKSAELVLARRRLGRALALIGAERSLVEARRRVGDQRGVLPALIAAAALELRLSSNIADKEGIKERVASRLARLEIAAGREMNRGTGLLATIGATAPFVGLFGTVWGIMNSFVGISKAQTTNLAVVAPGIAEALLATAIGLFAAIPAVVIYNQFARAIGAYRALIGDASAEVLRLVSRDLDRGERAALPKAAE
jgi:biopolymer transport protein ExbB